MYKRAAGILTCAVVATGTGGGGNIILTRFHLHKKKKLKTFLCICFNYWFEKKFAFFFCCLGPRIKKKIWATHEYVAWRKKKKKDLKATYEPKLKEHLTKQGYDDDSIAKAVNNAKYIKQTDGQFAVNIGVVELLCKEGGVRKLATPNQKHLNKGIKFENANATFGLFDAAGEPVEWLDSKTITACS